MVDFTTNIGYKGGKRGRLNTSPVSVDNFEMNAFVTEKMYSIKKDRQRTGLLHDFDQLDK